MAKTSTTTRWLITAVMAAWLPLCFCQASGFVRAGLGSVGLLDAAADSYCSCCEAAGRGAPKCASSRVACCGVSVKIAPKPQRWSPDDNGAGAPIALLPASFMLAPLDHARTPSAADVAAPPLPAQTLLRQGCALII